MAAKIIYRIATNPGDYNQCHQLMKDEGIKKPSLPLSFPTILIIEDLKLVGFMATRISDGMVLAGPLVLKSDRRRTFTAIRVLEHYQTAMRNLAIKHVVFSTKPDGFLERMRQKYCPDLVPYAVKDGLHFYLWEMNGYEQRGRRAEEPPKPGRKSIPGRPVASAAG